MARQPNLVQAFLTNKSGDCFFFFFLVRQKVNLGFTQTDFEELTTMGDDPRKLGRWPRRVRASPRIEKRDSIAGISTTRLPPRNELMLCISLWKLGMR